VSRTPCADVSPPRAPWHRRGRVSAALQTHTWSRFRLALAPGTRTRPLALGSQHRNGAHVSSRSRRREPFSQPRTTSLSAPVDHPCRARAPGPNPRPNQAPKRRIGQLRRAPARHHRGKCRRRRTPPWLLMPPLSTVGSGSCSPDLVGPKSNKSENGQRRSILLKSPSIPLKSTRSLSTFKNNSSLAQFLAPNPLSFLVFEPAVQPDCFSASALGSFFYK